MTATQLLGRFLPVIPSDLLAGRDRRQLDQQELNRIHGLAKLPVGELAPARHSAEIVGDRIAGQLPKRGRLQVAQEGLDETYRVRPRVLQDALALKPRDILVPARRGAVLAAALEGSGGRLGGPHRKDVRVIDCVQSFTLSCACSLCNCRQYPTPHKRERVKMWQDLQLHRISDKEAPLVKDLTHNL